MGVTCINILHTQHVITGVTNSLIKHSERVEVAQKASGGIPCGSRGVALTHNVFAVCNRRRLKPSLAETLITKINV